MAREWDSHFARIRRDSGPIDTVSRDDNMNGVLSPITRCRGAILTGSHSVSDPLDVASLEGIARKLRANIVRVIAVAGSGHRT